jgi:hypothetical protein
MRRIAAFVQSKSLLFISENCRGSAYKSATSFPPSSARHPTTAKFAVFFPVPGALPFAGDRFDIDCVRHQGYQALVTVHGASLFLSPMK